MMLEFFISISHMVAENPNPETEITGKVMNASIIKALAITVIKLLLSINSYCFKLDINLKT